LHPSLYRKLIAQSSPDEKIQGGGNDDEGLLRKRLPGTPCRIELIRELKEAQGVKREEGWRGTAGTTTKGSGDKRIGASDGKKRAGRCTVLHNCMICLLKWTDCHALCTALGE
jgi:hypothetical protein